MHPFAGEICVCTYVLVDLAKLGARLYISDQLPERREVEWELKSVLINYRI